MQNEQSTLSWKNYLELCKPKVVLLIIFTAVVGMLLAVPGMPPLDLVLYGTIGIGLASSSAAAINHFIDQKADAKMARTQNRPLPTGDLNSRNVLFFATFWLVLEPGNKFFAIPFFLLFTFYKVFETLMLLKYSREESN